MGRRKDTHHGQEEDTHLRINNGNKPPTSGSTTGINHHGSRRGVYPPWEQEGSVPTMINNSGNNPP